MNIKNLAKIADALKHPVKDSSDAALNNLKQTAETLKAIKALGYSVGWTANRYGSDYIYLKGIGFNEDPPQDVAPLWHKLESLVEKGTIMSEDILEDLGYHSSGNEGSYVKTNSSGDKASKTIKLSNRLNPLEALQKAGLLGSQVKDASKGFKPLLPAERDRLLKAFRDSTGGPETSSGFVRLRGHIIVMYLEYDGIDYDFRYMVVADPEGSRDDWDLDSGTLLYEHYGDEEDSEDFIDFNDLVKLVESYLTRKHSIKDSTDDAGYESLSALQETLDPIVSSFSFFEESTIDKGYDDWILKYILSKYPNKKERKIIEDAIPDDFDFDYDHIHDSYILTVWVS